MVIPYATPMKHAPIVLMIAGTAQIPAGTEHAQLMRVAIVARLIVGIARTAEMGSAMPEKVAFPALLIVEHVQKSAGTETVTTPRIVQTVLMIAGAVLTLAGTIHVPVTKHALIVPETAESALVVAMATVVVRKHAPIVSRTAEHAPTLAGTGYADHRKTAQTATQTAEIAVATAEMAHALPLKTAFRALLIVEIVNFAATELVIRRKTVRTATQTADFVLTSVVITYAGKRKIAATVPLIVATVLHFAATEDVKPLRTVLPAPMIVESARIAGMGHVRMTKTAIHALLIVEIAAASAGTVYVNQSKVA